MKDYALKFVFMMITVESTIIEGPTNVTYYPTLTVLPIELICNVTGVTAWSVNDRSYILGDLADGDLPGHNVTGNNILIEAPVNNTEYICVSQASGGGETRSDPAYIYIAGVPAMAPGVTVDNNTINVNGNNFTLTLSWGEPFNNFDPIVNYIVSCSGDVTCSPNPITTNTTTRSYTITNLTTMTTYTFSVVATNSIGSGEAGVVNYTTPLGLPNITNVTMERETCLAVSGSISWTANSSSFPVSYNVAFRSSDEIIVMSNTMNTSFEFIDLMPGRNYTIIIVSVSDIGIGFPEVRTFYIPTEQDAMLRGLKITEATSGFNEGSNLTTLRIIWSPAINEYCKVTHYLIMLCSNGNCSEMTVSGLSMSTIFTNAQNNTSYKITVTAFNEARNISDTKVLTVTLTSNSGSSSSGAIIGGVVGGVIAVIAVTAVVAGGYAFVYKYRKDKKNSAVPSEERRENQYTEANRSVDAPQEQNNLQYAYAVTGQRNIIFS